MVNPVSIALSGLNAAGTRIATAASNIANAATTGATTPENGPAAYTPQDVVDIPAITQNGEAQGVRATVIDRTPATTTVYSPDSPHADENGLIEAPNVDYTTELMSIKAATNAYKANAAVIRVSNEMEQELMGTFDEQA